MFRSVNHRIRMAALAVFLVFSPTLFIFSFQLHEPSINSIAIILEKSYLTADIPTWSEPILIDTAPSGNVHKDIHRQADDGLTVYYTPPDRNADVSIISSADGGSTWLPAENATVGDFSDSGSVWFTDVCRSGMGYVRISLFSDIGGVCQRIWSTVSTDTAGNSFSSPVLVNEWTGEAFAQIEPSIAVENDGTHHIVYQTKQFGGDWHIAYSSGTGYSWEDPIDMGVGTNPQILSTPYGDLILTYEENFYMDSSHPEIFVRTKPSDGSWTATSTVQEYVASSSPAGCADAWHAACLDSSNGVHIVYQSQQNTYYTYSSDYTTWASPQLVRASVGGDSRPGICISGKGTISTVFNDQSSSGMVFVEGSFAPSIHSVSHSPVSPIADEQVSVSATITDPSGIRSAYLDYRINGGVWTSIPMSNVQASTYEASTGPFDIGDMVDYNITAVDDSPQQNSVTSDNNGECFSFTVGDPDVTGPIITDVSRSPSFPTENDTVEVHATINDSSGVRSANVKYSINEGSWSDELMISVGTNQYEAEIGSFSTGDEIRFYITAVDASLNNNTSVDDNNGNYYTFTIGDNSTSADTTPPSFVITEPVNYTYCQSGISIRWSANDPESGIIAVSISIDGDEPEALADPEGLYYVSGLDDGEHMITITVENGNHLRTTKSVITFFDSVDPVISILFPSDGDVESEDGFTLMWNANDDQGECGEVDFYEVFLDSDLVGEHRDQYHVFDNLDDGRYTIRVVVCDKAGNQADDTIHIWIDTGAPTISTVSPDNSSEFIVPVKTTVDLSCMASDDAAVLSVVVHISGIDVTYEDDIQLSYVESIDRWKSSWNVASVSHGTYRITFKAQDMAGHITENHVSCTIRGMTIIEWIMANLFWIAPMFTIAAAIVGIVIKLRN